MFGRILHRRGFRRFGLRGLEKVRGEWTLAPPAPDPVTGERQLEQRAFEVGARGPLTEAHRARIAAAAGASASELL